MRLLIFLIFIFTFALMSCGQFQSIKDPRTIHGVNPIFKPYIDEYIYYKGRGLDYEIAIQFTDLPSNEGGLCTRFASGERQIEIDKDLWDNYLYEDTKLELIAHELGHCDLGRAHLTEVRDGKPISIMYPYMFSLYPQTVISYMSELFHRDVSMLPPILNYKETIH